MKHFKFLWTLMVLPLIAACSHDEIVNSNPGKGDIPEGEGVYMTVNFAPFNKGTRSFTNGNNSSDGGVEVGTDAENQINKVLIVLATVSNQYVASAMVDTGSSLTASNNNTTYQAKAKFGKTDIKAYYDLDEVKDYIKNKQETSSADINPPINVFIYCNPPEGFQEALESSTDWINDVHTLANNADNTLWLANGFLMTNEGLATRYFPYDFSTWNQFSSENNPFDLSGWNNRNQNTSVDNLTGRGTINVHRMAARFDFRDGSQLEGDGYNGIHGEPFSYSVMNNDAGELLVKATIINMSLVNILKKEYYLGRVSTATSNWSTNYSLLALENANNYVVTPEAAGRTGSELNKNNNFSTYYQYPFFGPDGKVATRGQGWFTTPVVNLFNAHPDSVAKYPVDENYSGNYHRWRYLTENTLMGGIEGQTNGGSTGIVFKTQLLPGEKLNNPNNYWDRQLYNTLSDRTSNGPVLFAFSNNLYCSWQQIQYAALKSAGYDVNGTANNQNLDKTGTFYKAVFGDGAPGVVNIIKEDGTTKTYAEYKPNENGEGYTTELAAQDQTSPNFLHSQLKDHDGGNPQTSGAEWDKFRDAVVANTFTIYEKFGEDTTNDGNNDTWGYYCYYYYWNRHNDNGDNNTMGTMEFAVVRNNVYKLAVTSIKKLGHPRIPENDPDAPKPDTPDEKADLYLTVSVQVLPWVVRVNNIDF